jgi:multidrug efflux pump subunit AcrA (membrane-fusion protein)
MRRLPKYVLVGFIVAIPVVFWFSRRQPPAEANQKVIPGSQVLLASPGRVEGLGETIAVGSATDGVVEAVLVTDGQEVTEGTVLALIACGDIKAEMEQAKAEAESARQSRIRVLRGHRKEERKAAAQKTAAAQAILNQATEHLNRMDTLYQKQEISRDLFEQIKRDSWRRGLCQRRSRGLTRT